jgi:hypothetical protein
MTADESAGDALFRDPLPEGFSRRVFEIAPGLELSLEPGSLPDAIVVVGQGELELEYRAGTCRRFGRGSMIPIALLPVSHLRNVGAGPLVLVAVSRAPLRATESFAATRDPSRAVRGPAGRCAASQARCSARSSARKARPGD